MDGGQIHPGCQRGGRESRGGGRRGCRGERKAARAGLTGAYPGAGGGNARGVEKPARHGLLLQGRGAPGHARDALACSRRRAHHQQQAGPHGEGG